MAFPSAPNNCSSGIYESSLALNLARGLILLTSTVRKEPSFFSLLRVYSHLLLSKILPAIFPTVVPPSLSLQKL